MDLPTARQTKGSSSSISQGHVDIHIYVLVYFDTALQIESPCRPCYRGDYTAQQVEHVVGAAGMTSPITSNTRLSRGIAETSQYATFTCPAQHGQAHAHSQTQQPHIVTAESVWACVATRSHGVCNLAFQANRQALVVLQVPVVPAPAQICVLQDIVQLEVLQPQPGKNLPGRDADGLTLQLFPDLSAPDRLYAVHQHGEAPTCLHVLFPSCGMRCCSWGIRHHVPACSPFSLFAKHSTVFQSTKSRQGIVCAPPLQQT